MPLSPEADDVLYAGKSGASLEAQLEAALARNVAGGLAVAETASLATIADIVMRENEILFPEMTDVFALSPKMAVKASRAHELTSRLAESVGVDMPTFKELAHEGVDFNKLASSHETMTRLGMMPELVIAPVLTLEQWKVVYKSLHDDLHINHAGHIKNGGFWVTDDVVEGWDELQNHDRTVNIAGQRWDVLIVPGTNQPTATSTDYHGKEHNGKISEVILMVATELGLQDDQIPTEALNPTIDAYLTLQANSFLQANTSIGIAAPPVDYNSCTWLDAELPGDRAVLGYWKAKDGMVCLGWRHGLIRDAKVGVRVPVWGTS